MAVIGTSRGVTVLPALLDVFPLERLRLIPLNTFSNNTSYAAVLGVRNYFSLNGVVVHQLSTRFFTVKIPEGPQLEFISRLEDYANGPEFQSSLIHPAAAAHAHRTDQWWYPERGPFNVRNYTLNLTLPNRNRPTTPDKRPLVVSMSADGIIHTEYFRYGTRMVEVGDLVDVVFEARFVSNTMIWPGHELDPDQTGGWEFSLREVKIMSWNKGEGSVVITQQVDAGR